MKSVKTARGRGWLEVDSLLRRWLAERQELLSLYCTLSGAVRAPVRITTHQKLDRFCEILVDYVSAGHFEVYCELLDEGARFGPARRREAAGLYARILPTTAVALDFNDRYLRSGMGENIAADLSELGQMLAARFDLEDALIRLLHLDTRAVA